MSAAKSWLTVSRLGMADLQGYVAHTPPVLGVAAGGQVRAQGLRVGCVLGSVIATVALTPGGPSEIRHLGAREVRVRRGGRRVERLRRPCRARVGHGRDASLTQRAQVQGGLP